MKTLQFVSSPTSNHLDSSTIVNRRLNHIIPPDPTGFSQIFSDIIHHTPRAFASKMDFTNINNKRVASQSFPILHKLIMGDIIRIHDQVNMVRKFNNSKPVIYTVFFIPQFMEERITKRVDFFDSLTSSKSAIISKSQGEHLWLFHSREQSLEPSFTLSHPSFRTDWADLSKSRITPNLKMDYLPTGAMNERDKATLRTTRRNILYINIRKGRKMREQVYLRRICEKPANRSAPRLLNTQ